MKNKQVLVLYGTKIYRRKLYGKEKEKKNLHASVSLSLS